MRSSLVPKFNSFPHRPAQLMAIGLLLTIVLSACGSAAPSPTEALPAQVATGVVATLTAQPTATVPATQTPMAAPTQTLPATAIATNGTGTPAAGIPITGGSTSTSSTSTASGCNDAAFVRDVTIPDGTTVAPGASFTKTWELTNTGTCNWNNKYSLVFMSGDKMGGTNTTLGQNVGVNQNGQLSVQLTAPTTNGTYTGYWKLADASGNTFGTTVFVQITVGQKVVVTVVVTATP